jgi:hypothetical protein
MPIQAAKTSPPPPAPVKPTETVLRECAICQSSIYTAEKTTTCPKCGLVFHAECWQENMGCAAYGCDQVNALAPKEESKPVEALPQPIVAELEPLPWSFLLLGAAALTLLASALSYGIPSGLIAVASGMRMLRKRRLHDRPLLWAAILSLLGIVLGLVISPIWWARDYTK